MAQSSKRLLGGLEPRSGAPRCEEISAPRLRSVDHVVVDCDGLLWNMTAKESVESSAERYLKQNAAPSQPLARR